MPSADVVGAGVSGPADLHKTHFYNILGRGGQWWWHSGPDRFL